MRYDIPLTLTVVALLVTAGTATAAVTGSPEIDVTFQENTVSPGEETTLDVVLVNSGDVDSGSAQNPSLNSEVTTARGLTVDLGSDDAPISVTTDTRSVGTLEQGPPETVSFDVSVDEDASPGKYRVPVRLSYTYTNLIAEESGARYESSVETTRYLTVHVSEEATFDVTNVDSDARVGSSGTVAVTVENTGQEVARDASVTLSSRNQNLGVGGGTEGSRYVDVWETGERRTFRYQVSTPEDAEPEPYEFGLSVEFDDADGVRKESVGTSVGIAPQPEQEFSLSGVNATLEAGNDGQLEATLTNDGPRTVENAVLNWHSEHSNLSPQETQYAVGDLGPGESATVSFGVDVSDSADAGPRQFDFNAVYRDDDGDRYESDTMEVRADVAASEDEFAVEAANATVGAGGASTLELTVTNAEDVPLTDISAKLFADSPISVDDDEAYIDRLDAGESTTLTFGISASGGAMEKQYPVSLDFQYEEPDGDTPVSDTYRVAVGVTTSDGGGLPLSAIGAVLVVSLLAIGGYVRFR